VFASTILAGIVLYLLVRAILRVIRRPLASKFQRAGRLPGKTRAEIISFVGRPTRVSALPGGHSLLQWMATGYHMSLRFKGDVCDGVVQEMSSDRLTV
jgi:hypothetical protein